MSVLTPLAPAPSSLLREFEHVFKKLTARTNLSPEDTALKSNPNQMKNIIKSYSSPEHSERLLNEFFFLGPLKPLIDDPQVSEIIINGREAICYEQNGELKALNDCFLSELTFNNFVHRICEEVGTVLTLNQLFADGYWRGWRVHLARKPVVHVPFHLSFRRHPKNPWTFSSLQNKGWAPKGAVELIKKLIKTRKNILICGPTSSGKTSVLNACLQCLPPHERVIAIEDSHELLLPNSFSSKLLARQGAHENLVPIDQSELVRQSLRMRPDRIIMGEARGKEAKDLLMALATGHKGSLGTLHAQDHKQALWRLEMLIQTGAPSWSVHTIRQMIALSIDCLMILDRQETQRYLKGIYKLSGLENTGFLFETLFVCDLKTQLQELLPLRDRGGG